MKKNRWSTTVILILAAVLVWWFIPRGVIPRQEITTAVIESGLTGIGRDFQTPEELQELTDALADVRCTRTTPVLLGTGGYSYIIHLYDSSGTQILGITLYDGHAGRIGAANVLLRGDEALWTLAEQSTQRD